MDTLQAAILNVKLNYLEEWNERRRSIAQRYNELLSGQPVITPRQNTGSIHVYHQYTIRTPLRDQLAAYLKERGVVTMIYYPIPLHLQPLYSDLRTPALPNAERAAQEVLSLPICPELSSKDQEFIVELIRDFFDDQD